MKQTSSVLRAKRWSTSIAVLGLAVATVPAFAAVEIDTNTFGAWNARSIGPAVMSGRIAALAVVGEDPLTIYVGAASGGVWKSEDAGVTFQPVFDDHWQSIGALAADPNDGDTVWAGTGESWTRNSTSIGNGIYKTTDGGESWTHLGLEATERIARIRVDSTDSDTVYVCATGQLWSANEERGVYKTTNGGESWELVLSVDADTGCSDIDIDPQDPQILYAGMWQFRRYPDYFESGGPGSGLYKTTDGGETWREVTEGLPAGDKGRIAVAVAPSRPSRVYSIVESEETTAAYRSDNLGETWTEVNSSFNVKARPFYFAYLVVDPIDYNRVYKPGLVLTVSIDGGKSFTSPFTGGFGGNVHSDHHALWVNPSNPHEVILGTDGGLYISADRAGTWRFVHALPISQFYEVSYDMEHPYNVYGGLQDNGTWMGPTRGAGGIRSRDWTTIGFGDGFHAYVDRSDSNVVYVEYQGGQLLRYHRDVGEIKQIKPYRESGDPELRFNWNAPIHLSPSDSGVLYYGSQFVHRSTDRGESWQKISPDLTTNDPQLQRQKSSGGLTIDNSTAENNATIFTISESPLEAQTIWVGTDDGNVQVTRDGGESWQDVTGNVPDMPARTWVSHVSASPHQAGAAYATFDGHRTGDMTTYVYTTGDYGATWQALPTEGIEGFAHVIEQDPVNPELLYLGTELGLYISVSSGQQWARFAGDVPKVPLHDLDIHPREHDLILGTHGRGIYILDDLTPLRHLTEQALEEDLAILPSRPAVMTVGGGLSWFNGDDQFVGRNPAEAATIVYYLKKRHIFGDLKVEIYDADGELIKTLPGGKRKGINRVEWPMRLPAPKLPPASSLAPAFVGPRVPEGTYSYKIIKGKKTYEGEVALVVDPTNPHPAADRELQQTKALELYDRLEDLTYTVDTALDIRDRARAQADELGDRDRLARQLRTIADEFDEFRSGLVSTSGAGWLSGDEKLREQLSEVYNGIVTYSGRPTQSQLDRAGILDGELAAAESKLAELTASRALATANRQLASRDLPTIEPLGREAWEAEQEAAGGTTAASKAALKLRPLVERFLVSW